MFNKHKDSTENALLDIINDDIINDKRSYDASNDPSMQRKKSFARTLYCQPVPNGVNCAGTLRIGYQNSMPMP